MTTDITIKHRGVGISVPEGTNPKLAMRYASAITAVIERCEKPEVEPAWVSLEVACESIHVRRSDGTTGPISYDALRKRIARGHIPVRRMGGSIMVNLETLKNMKASR